MPLCYNLTPIFVPIDVIIGIEYKTCQKGYRKQKYWCNDDVWIDTHKTDENVKKPFNIRDLMTNLFPMKNWETLHHNRTRAVVAYVQYYLHHTQRKIKNNVKQSEKNYLL